jgi:Cu(I)/Ag(I) efflux system membrane fusion protein
MKATTLAWVLGFGLLGVGIGWWVRDRSGPAGDRMANGTAPGRAIRFYQSPMHPWITSPEPGNCTICGMKLVAVYEGESGAASDADGVVLGENSIRVTGIASASVEERSLVRTLRFSGTLDDDDTRHRVLSAVVEGRVESLGVNFVGVEVREGDELAQVYSPVWLAAAREYVELVRSGAGLEWVGPAGVRLRQMGMTDRQVKELPDTLKEGQRTLPWISPVSGTVVSRTAYAGQWLKEGEPLFEIADFDVMWFKFDAYERDLAWLKEGQEVVVTTPSLPGESFTNRIAFIDPNLSMMTRSTQVRVELENPDRGDGRGRVFRHRLYAEARVRVETGPVRTVPRSAVLNPGGSPGVWVERAAGSYRHRPVRLGRLGDEAWEVVSGLELGERVVVQGGLLLDAQSQMQTGLTTVSEVMVPEVMTVPGETWTPGDPSMEAAVVGWVRTVTPVLEALAADDLAGFHRGRAAWVAALEPLRGPGGPPESWVKDLPEARDLSAARKSVHETLVKWTPWMGTFRSGRDELKELYLYRCPMTSRAFPGAPREATWWQWGKPVRNPWFGQDMLECGVEVR